MSCDLDLPEDCIQVAGCRNLGFGLILMNPFVNKTIWSLMIARAKEIRCVQRRSSHQQRCATQTQTAKASKARFRPACTMIMRSRMDLESHQTPEAVEMRGVDSEPQEVGGDEMEGLECTTGDETPPKIFGIHTKPSDHSR